MTMTDNRAYKQEIRDFMAVSPAKLNYTDAKKIVDAQKEFDLNPQRFGEPKKAFIPHVWQLPEAFDVLEEFDLDYDEWSALEAYESAFLFNLDDNERLARKELVAICSAESLVRQEDVAENEPLDYSRVLVRLVAEIGMDKLREMMARVFVYIYTNYQIGSDQEAVIDNANNPEYVNELLKVYGELADAQILSLATYTLREPAWCPIIDDWKGFGSSGFGSVTFDNHMDFTIIGSPTYPFNVSKLDDMVAQMRESKKLTTALR